MNFTINLRKGQYFGHSPMGLMKHCQDCEIMYRECKEWLIQGQITEEAQKNSIYYFGQNHPGYLLFLSLLFDIFEVCEYHIYAGLRLSRNQSGITKENAYLGHRKSLLWAKYMIHVPLRKLSCCLDYHYLHN